jgi:acyl-CoA synthetase (AMP-forming)/AMP-acid ligase II
MDIGLLLDLGADLAGDRIAVGRGADALTYAELEQRVAIAAGLIRGTSAHSVAFLGASGPAFHLALFAAARSGLPLAPLDPRLPPHRVTELLDRLDTPLLVTDEAPAPGWARSPGVLTSHEMLTARPFLARRPVADVDVDSTAVVLFGQPADADPQAVLLSHSGLIASVLEHVEPGSAGPDEAALVCVPPYHLAGVTTVLTNTTAGRRVVHLQDLTPEAWLDAVAQEQVTSALVTPTLLARIVDHLDVRDDAAAVPLLRDIRYAGDGAADGLTDAARRVFGAATG